MLDEEAVRIAKIKSLREAGIEPFPSDPKRTHTIQTVLEEFTRLETAKTQLKIVGRVRTKRKHGAMSFLDLEDGTGKIQVALRRDEVGVEAYERFHNFVDVGDFLEVHGVVFVTKRGERTVDTATFRILTKAVLPLPEKWHGLTDVEARYRKRHLDLIANPEVRAIFKKRSLIIQTIRTVLEREGFMEVETPILQTIAGGAAAKPFVTHHNVLGIDLFLRIAPELYLKRLIVGGFEKVYEIARCFRNEGVSFQHNPEFTQVEFYWAYANYDDLIRLSETLVMEAAEKVTGGKNTVERDGATLHFKTPFPRLSFFDLVMQKTGIDLDQISDEAELLQSIKSKKLAVRTDGAIGYGELVDQLYKDLIRPNIVQPTFVVDYPAQLKPLAKRKPGEPNKACALQLVVQGMELTNAYYAEQNDPIEQAERFAEEQKTKELGAQTAMSVDADFVEALKHGMPPTAGFGMGLDRLCSVLLGAHSLKEVILFPTMKPGDNDKAQMTNVKLYI